MFQNAIIQDIKVESELYAVYSGEMFSSFLAFFGLVLILSFNSNIKQQCFLLKT